MVRAEEADVTARAKRDAVNDRSKTERKPPGAAAPVVSPPKSNFQRTGPGSRREIATKRRWRAAFRFFRNGKRSSSCQKRRTMALIQAPITFVVGSKIVRAEAATDKLSRSNVIVVETIDTKDGSRSFQIMQTRKDYDSYAEKLCNP
jgi:hypothetical protein